MKSERFLSLISFIPYGTPNRRFAETITRSGSPAGIHKLKPILLVLPALLATLLLALPSTGPAEPIPVLAAATGRLPQSEQTTLADLPLPAQFSISEAIGRDQTAYHLTPTSTGFQAIFPRQSLTANFTSAGLDLRAGDEHWTLSLTDYGYGDHLTPVEPASPQAEANRLEYHRGPLTEWYQHGPLGLQQGFTLSKRPASSGLAKSETDESPLTLALRLTGDGPCSLGPCARCSGACSHARRSTQRGQAASVSEDGLSLKLGSLSYTGLLAYDAAGRELQAWLELHDDRLLLRVDDRNATYPVLIDPWVQLKQVKLTASDGMAVDQFGQAVAVSGDTVVVGAGGDDSGRGAAYVFVKPRGSWTATNIYAAKLIASDGQTKDRFGLTVAISGDTIVVGAPQFYAGGRRGAAYVFVRPDEGWATTTETAKLTAPDGAADDWFGDAVATNGYAIVVGAPLKDDRNFDDGVAYVFIKPSGGWGTVTPQIAKLTAFAPNSGGDDRFGMNVTISSDTVVVGAPGNNYSRGAAYIFVKPDEGWAATNPLTETTKLVASDGAERDNFAYVAISGDTIVVGASGDDVRDNDSGSAYVFVKPGGGWATTNPLTETTKLIASDGSGADYFGCTVAVHDDTIVVGAYGSNNQDVVNSGSAYVFVKPSGGWATTKPLTEIANITASDSAMEDRFGFAVAISGDTIVAGTPQDDDNRGAAYIFTPPSYLYLPVVVKPAVGALIFRNDTPNPVRVTLFDYGTREFGVGQQIWSDIPVRIYDWEATGTCDGQSGTVGSRQTGNNRRAPITITANQTATLNAEKGGIFSCGN